MKVIFVELFADKGKKPLDSSTASGQVIDQIINRLGGIEAEKQTLFPTHQEPTSADRQQYIRQFHIDEEAIYVTIGWDVSNYLRGKAKILPVTPLNSIIAKGDKHIKEYVNYVASLIQNYI